MDVDLETDEFTVTYDPTLVDTGEMIEAIVEAGYKPKIAPSRVETDGATSDAGSNWAMPELLVSAFLEADGAHKLVFIDFFAEWCGACITLDKTTLLDPAVKTALERFVFIKVDTDLHPRTAKHFRVAGMPTLVVVDFAGEEIYRHTGPIEAEQLAQELSLLPVERK